MYRLPRRYQLAAARACWNRVPVSFGCWVRRQKVKTTIRGSATCRQKMAIALDFLRHHPRVRLVPPSTTFAFSTLLSPTQPLLGASSDCFYQLLAIVAEKRAGVPSATSEPRMSAFSNPTLLQSSNFSLGLQAKETTKGEIITMPRQAGLREHSPYESGTIGGDNWHHSSQRLR